MIDTKKTIKLVVIGVIVLIVLITLFNSFTTVPTGFVGVKTHFGKVQNDVLQEGINGKIPFIEKIILIDCKTKKVEVTAESSSKDMQNVKVTIAVNYNVMKDTANQLYREVGVDYENVIVSPAILESIKRIMAQYTAEELVTKRSEVANIIINLLTEKLENRGILITALNITDLSFSEEFDQAIEKKQVVEQQTKQAKYELEKARVENEKKIENAKAEAEVMKQQNKEITEKTLELKRLEIQQKLIEKWNGQLPTTATDDVLSIFNLNK